MWTNAQFQIYYASNFQLGRVGDWNFKLSKSKRSRAIWGEGWQSPTATCVTLVAPSAWTLQQTHGYDLWAACELNARCAGERDASALAAGERGGDERPAPADDSALLSPTAHLHAGATHAQSRARARARLPRDTYGMLIALSSTGALTYKRVALLSGTSKQ